jgi:hypothetical protein
METMSVAVRSAQLREGPSFLSRVLENLGYGSRIETGDRQDGWIRARSGSREGWLHESALSEKEIVLNPGVAEVRRAANSSEIALAGKGFSANVEAEYRRRNTGLNFAAVDVMESRPISDLELARFVREGNLSGV